jgi:hypothetical protein
VAADRYFSVTFGTNSRNFLSALGAVTESAFLRGLTYLAFGGVIGAASSMGSFGVLAI